MPAPTRKLNKNCRVGRLCLRGTFVPTRDDVGIVPYADFAHFPTDAVAPVGPRRAGAACRHFRPSAGNAPMRNRSLRAGNARPYAKIVQYLQKLPRGSFVPATGRCGHRPLRRFCTFPDKICRTRRATACRGRVQAFSSVSGQCPDAEPLIAGGQCPPLRGIFARCKPVTTGRCGHRPLRRICKFSHAQEAAGTRIPSRFQREECTKLRHKFPHAHEKNLCLRSRDRGLLCGTTLVAPRCGTTRSAITGANRPRLRICARQTSGGCSGVIFTRRCTALHRPAALWIRGGRCLSPSRRLNFEFFTAFSGRNSVRIADLQTFSAFPAAGTRSGA